MNNDHHDAILAVVRKVFTDIKKTKLVLWENKTKNPYIKDCCILPFFKFFFFNGSGKFL